MRRHPCSGVCAVSPQTLSCSRAHLNHLSPLAALTHPSPHVYAERRRALCQTLAPHTVLLIPAADEVAMSHDIFYPFHQDAMFFHLFGLPAPLRRSLAPATAVATEDVRATMAAFVKDARGACQVLLCVPEPTLDMATAVWATEPCAVDVVAAATSHICSDQDVPVCVLGNRVAQVAQRLTKEIACLIEIQRTMQTNEDATTASLKRLLPIVQVALPSSVRMHSERYRVLRPEAASTRTGESADRVHNKRTPAAVHFLHPLEALFAHLMAATFETAPDARPREGDGGERARRGDPRHSPHLCYTLPTRSGAEAGEAFALLTPPSETVDTLRQWRATSTAASASFQPARDGPVQTGVVVPSRIRSARDTLWRYRLRKSPAQLAQHLLSARVTRDAFLAAMRAAATTTSEFDIHCAFEQSLLRSRRTLGSAAGARGRGRCVESAYVPVVAAGEHATQIHYVENDGEADTGDLVRLDAGAMVCQVPTDCTRTFPLNQAFFGGKSLKVDAYRSLLGLQRSLLKAMRPGASPYDVARLHVTLTREHLVALGVGESPQTGDKKTLEASLVHGVFCAHGFGHFFGLDLHEQYAAEPILSPPTAGANETAQAKPKLSYAPMVFEGGMMHTVEPGFYFPSVQRAERSGFDPRAVSLVPPGLRGVGVQVEDDVLVLPAADASDTTPSRAAFLATAVTTHRDLLHWDQLMPDTSLPMCSLRANSDAVAAVVARIGGRASIGLAAVSFLFEQRACMDGVEAALDALPRDAAACAECSDVDGLARFAAYYPYDVIVTTACVPKDVEDIERLMTQVSPIRSPSADN